MLYHQDLTGWAAWSREYQNIAGFTPLAQEIYRRSGVPFVPLSPLTPGTNAVFRSGETVIKIYTPAETGLSGMAAYETELFAMRHSMACGFPAPKVLASGFIDDKYRFPYLIMEYIDAPEFLSVRPSLSHETLTALAADWGERLRRLHLPVARFTPTDACARVAENKRWDVLPPAFRREALRIAEEASKEPLVYVHGDLNGDNVLFQNEALYAIDFADSTLAPHWYEDVCVVCDLFDFDPACAQAYTSISGEALARRLYRSIMLHEFGAEIIRSSMQERLGSGAVQTPEALLRALVQWACGT